MRGSMQEQMAALVEFRRQIEEACANSAPEDGVELRDGSFLETQNGPAWRMSMFCKHIHADEKFIIIEKTQRNNLILPVPKSQPYTFPELKCVSKLWWSSQKTQVDKD